MTAKARDLIISYTEDLQLFRTGVRKFWFGILLLALAIAPWAGASLGGNYLPYLLNLTGIAVIVALGVNLIIGWAGLISLGQAAFLAVGAYTSGILVNQLGFPFGVALIAAGLFSGLLGLIVGLPALRLKGLYLALATLAFQFILEHILVHTESLTGGPNGMMIPRPEYLDTDIRYYYVITSITVLLAFGMTNLARSRFGRALIALRDSDVAAEAVGVNLAYYKTLAFGLSSAYTGIAGSLFAHYFNYIGPDHFTMLLSIEYIVMIIVGGIGSILGSVLGAIFITLMPEAVRALESWAREIAPHLVFPDLRAMVVGAVLVLFIAFEPEGLAGRWRKIKEYWTEWPF
jgi:branched-chain amino acid transport system permease protein